MTLSSAIEYQPIGELHPDPGNPRLRQHVRDTLRDDELLVHLADNFDPLMVADSIARHGFFGSEPLIVLDDAKLGWVVLEGNRRLTALLGLARPDLRARFQDHAEWDRLEPVQPVTVETRVPVLRAERREDADAVIGFRHIGGAMAWKPLNRAQFVAHLVDDRSQSFEEVADTVGEDVDTVKMRYRNQSVLLRASVLGRPDVLEAGERSFGIYTAALNRTGLRDFIGAYPVGQVQEREPQLEDDNLPWLIELFGFLYGVDREGKVCADGSTVEDGERKVIRESRDLSMLAAVVQRENALTELRRSRDLDAAYALTPAPNSNLIRQLGIAAGNLRAAVSGADLIVDDPRTRERAEEMQELLRELFAALGDRDETEIAE